MGGCKNLPNQAGKRLPQETIWRKMPQPNNKKAK
jgi:hypothetical protein